MGREVVPVGEDEYGGETHPAFGGVSVHRVSSTPGAVLFDSDVQHGHYVVVRVDRATRKRDLNRDWIHNSDVGKIVEFAMSEAQWASLVSSTNTAGVPCTLQRTEKDGRLPELPYDQRLKLSMKETREAAHRAFDPIKEAFAKVQEKPTKANIRALEIVLGNAVPNVEFAAKSLTEHAENVVQRSRADIEAMMIANAEAMGIAPPRYAPLEAGDDEPKELES